MSECVHRWKELPDDYMNYLVVKKVLEPDKIFGITLGHSTAHHIRLMEYCESCGIVRINPDDIKKSPLTLSI